MSTTEDSIEAYMAKTIKQTLTVSVLGREVELPLKDVADGCIGLSLWFDTLEHAHEWGGDDTEYVKGQYKPVGDYPLTASTGRRSK